MRVAPDDRLRADSRSPIDVPLAKRRVAAAVAAGVVLLLLAVSAIYTITAIQRNLFVAGPGLTNRLGYGIGTDFPAFYAAAVEAHRGNAGSVYDMEALRAVHAELRGVNVYPYALTCRGLDT